MVNRLAAHEIPDSPRQTYAEGTQGLPADLRRRAVEEYLAVLDDAVFGGATPVEPGSRTAAVALSSRNAHPILPARKVTRSIHEGARDLARVLSQEDEWIASRRERKKVEMLFAHLKRIMRLDRLRLRGPNGARDEFHLAAAAQNLRKLAKISLAKQLAMT